MTTPIALSGMASGLDTEAIITQLMSVESVPRTRMVLADTQAQARQTTLRDLATRLAAVRDAATALSSTTTWTDTQKLSTSDPARVTISAASTAAPGAHRIEVSQLAVAAQHAFKFGAGGPPDSIKINGFTLDVNPADTVTTIASALNADANAPVSAVVAGGLLVLTSRTTGVTGFTVEGPVGDPSPLEEQILFARGGLDAEYKLDGVDMPDSHSNVLKNVILGAEVTLTATTTAGTPVTFEIGAPGVDVDAAKAKVKTFVNAYNSAVDFIRGKLTEKPVKNPATNSDAVKGLFYGDTMLSGALSSMRSQIGDLADIGVSTGVSTGTATVSADSVAGRLTVDDTKLSAALASDPAALRTRMQALGARVSTVVAPLAGATMDARISSVDALRKRLATDMAATDVRLAGKEKRMRAQFAAMESALAAGQAAQAQLTAQLSAL
jgi:flagellar hook-associated protein 2